MCTKRISSRYSRQSLQYSISWIAKSQKPFVGFCRHVQLIPLQACLGPTCTVLSLLTHTPGSAAQEFEPWVKWVIMDALLALAVGLLSTRVPRLQSAFRAIGWA